MTPLRQRMIEDLRLRGYSPRTEEAYVHAAKQLAAHYRLSPEQITEAQLRDFFIAPIPLSDPEPRRLSRQVPVPTPPNPAATPPGAPLAPPPALRAALRTACSSSRPAIRPG
jgi:hypothetical protein